MGSWEEKKHAPLSVIQSQSESQSESQTAESSEQFEIELKRDLNVLGLFRPNNLQHVMLPDLPLRSNNLTEPEGHFLFHAVFECING